MTSVEVSNDELRTVREAMRQLNLMVDALEVGDVEKYVLCRGRRMRAVLMSFETFVALQEARR